MSQKDKTWKEIPAAGVCWKSSQTYLTGDWKSFTPIRDVKKCTKCLICTIYCPDGAIHWNKKTGDIEFDLNFCKGCGICANECPTKAITMKVE
jgi:2-oxoacid:acceptor oxidoreductase delta subunit (pyruvate/2-ketoisovalerate family)